MNSTQAFSENNPMQSSQLDILAFRSVISVLAASDL
jgi:hypothetical protein